MTERISRPELWAIFKDALERDQISHLRFDQLLDQYDRGLLGMAGDAVAWAQATEVGQLSVSAALNDAVMNPELASFAALMAADYDRAKEIVKAMVPTDRAVLEFWATELSQLVSHVQITEERF